MSFWFPLQVVGDAARTSSSRRLPLGMWCSTLLAASFAFWVIIVRALTAAQPALAGRAAADPALP